MKPAEIPAVVSEQLVQVNGFLHLILSLQWNRKTVKQTIDFILMDRVFFSDAVSAAL